MKIQVVDSRFIDRAWKDGAHNLSEAIKYSGGEITPDQLKMMLSRGERTLLAGIVDNPVGWAVVGIDQFPNLRALHIYALYAPNRTYPAFWEQLKSFASENGCSQIRCSAKPAQARLYRMKWGFEPVYETLKVDIS